MACNKKNIQIYCAYEELVHFILNCVNFIFFVIIKLLKMSFKKSLQE